MSLKIKSIKDLPESHPHTGELFIIPDISHEAEATRENVWEHWKNSPACVVFLGGQRYTFDGERFCPFCMGKARIERDPEIKGRIGFYRMSCIACGACGPVATGKTAAFTKWNTRTT